MDPQFDTLQEIFPGQYNYRLEDLQEETCKSLVDLISDSSDIEETINTFLNSNADHYEKLYSIGVSAILTFIQHNWTGPFDDALYFPSLAERAIKEFTTYEEPNENVIHLELLYLARIIFTNKQLQDKFPITIWWSLRANIIYERILDDASTALMEETEKIIDQITDETLLNNNNLKVMFSLELAHHYVSRMQDSNSEKYLIAAQSLLNLNANLKGAMGKRTKHQHGEKPQLVLEIKANPEIVPSKSCSNLPKPLPLNDDVRLEKIQLSEEQETVNLGVLEESAILTKYFQLYAFEPKDGHLHEILAPYLEPIIENSKNWPLRISALHQRCKLESNHKRTVERSMMQTEHLIEQMKDKKTPVTERVDFFFSSGMKPIWYYKQSLADLMLNLGMVKTALDIYINLQLWEEVIVCYTILGLKHKAVEIIKQELAKKPTVKLLCLLGDVTNTEKHYEEAWELSGKKSSRAQRHWGFYYYSKKKYKEAIPYLEKSVELNFIQAHVWSKLGYAALDTENWELAAQAYRNYCNLEQGSFEGWNNLAKAYIKLKKKESAWSCLRNAVQYNYDCWEVWDNLMVTSVDLSNFSEVLRCYHRILDIKGRHVDIEVLDIMKVYIVDKFHKTIESDEKESVQRLIENILQFFGRLTSMVTSNSDVWLIYGTIAALKDNERAVQHFKHAYGTAVCDPRWSNQVDSSLKVLELCIILADAILKCVKDSVEKQKCISMLGSAKLSLNSAITKVKKEQLEDVKLHETLKEVEDKWNIIVGEIERIKNVA